MHEKHIECGYIIINCISILIFHYKWIKNQIDNSISKYAMKLCLKMTSDWFLKNEMAFNYQPKTNLMSYGVFLVRKHNGLFNFSIQYNGKSKINILWIFSGEKTGKIMK
jgi:hypothetical protein